MRLRPWYINPRITYAYHIRVSFTRAHVRADTSAYAHAHVVCTRIGYARAHVRRSQEFGGVDKLEAVFKDKAIKVFGSGWVWLVWYVPPVLFSTPLRTLY